MLPKGTNPFSRLICKVESKIPFYEFTHFAACPQAKPLNSDIVKSYLGESSELIETPGHTSDSISILLDNHISIVGDAMVNMLGNTYPPFANEEKMLISSWKILLDTQSQLFCPAHGNLLKRERLLSLYKKNLLKSSLLY